MSNGRDTEDNNPVVRPSVFLERQSYRRRRLTDAARLLPILGAALFAVPLLWPIGGEEADPVPMSAAISYIFICWIALILAGAAFGFAARRLVTREAEEAEPEQWQR